jgi:hypothetical protein
MPCRALPAILTVAATLVAGTALADDVSGTVTEINKGRGTLTINGQELYTISIPMENVHVGESYDAEYERIGGKYLLTKITPKTGKGQ